MSEATIRGQIYSILSAVTNIGKVYDYERWAVDWASFINLFKATVGGVDQIRGWEICRKSVGEIGAAGGFEDKHDYQIRGYMGIQDANATEKTFSALIEAIREAFRRSDRWNLGGLIVTHDYIQVPVIEPRMFGSVLCHYAELNLDVTETIV